MSSAEAVERAMSLASAGLHQEAMDCIKQVLAAGEPEALRAMAIWKLVGIVMARDVPGARVLLRQAIEAGDVESAMLEATLCANGSGAAADWPRAIGLLKTYASHHVSAARQLELLAEMRLSSSGAPVQAAANEILGRSPLVVRFPKFLSATECAEIAMAAQDILEPATIFDPNTGLRTYHPIRTSYGAVIGPTRENPVINAINRRIAAATQTLVEQGEPLSLLHYSPGQQYRPHLDAVSGLSNQRIATVLLYLNDAYTGGETLFTKSRLKVSPRIGDAVFFRNVRLDGTIDPDTEHAGLPVTRGVKWLATRWIRKRVYDPWRGD